MSQKLHFPLPGDMECGDCPVKNTENQTDLECNIRLHSTFHQHQWIFGSHRENNKQKREEEVRKMIERKEGTQEINMHNRSKRSRHLQRRGTSEFQQRTEREILDILDGAPRRQTSSPISPPSQPHSIKPWEENQQYYKTTLDMIRQGRLEKAIPPPDSSRSSVFQLAGRVEATSNASYFTDKPTVDESPPTSAVIPLRIELASPVKTGREPRKSDYKSPISIDSSPLTFQASNNGAQRGRRSWGKSIASYISARKTSLAGLTSFIDMDSDSDESFYCVGEPAEELETKPLLSSSKSARWRASMESHSTISCRSCGGFKAEGEKNICRACTSGSRRSMNDHRKGVKQEEKKQRKEVNITPDPQRDQIARDIRALTSQKLYLNKELPPTPRDVQKIRARGHSAARGDVISRVDLYAGSKASQRT